MQSHFNTIKLSISISRTLPDCYDLGLPDCIGGVKESLILRLFWFVTLPYQILYHLSIKYHREAGANHTWCKPSGRFHSAQVWRRDEQPFTHTHSHLEAIWYDNMITDLSNLHVFELEEETWAPRGSPHWLHTEIPNQLTGSNPNLLTVRWRHTVLSATLTKVRIIVI